MRLKDKKTWFLTVIVFVFIIGIIVDESGLLVPIERQVLDYKFSARNRIEQADTNIVFVAIDQSSLTFFDNEHVAWPWPRIFYAKTIEFLNRSEAKAIIIDIDLSSKVNETEGDSEESDNEFIESLKNSNNPFLISILSNDSSDYNNYDLNRFSISQISEACNENYSGLVLPKIEYLTENVGLGIVNLKTSDDGIIRNTCLAYRLKGINLPSLPFAVYTSLDKKQTNKINKYQDSELFINWYGKGGPGGSYKYYSIVSIILSQLKLEEGLPPIINQDIFKNKIVFIGGTAPSLLDYKATPMSKLGIFPAMEIHANVLNNLMHNDFLIIVPRSIILIVNLIIIIAVIYFILFSDNILKSVILSFIPIALFVSLSLLLFRYNINISIASTIFDSIIALISSLILVYIFEGREKRELKQIFTKYVSPAIVEEILKNPNEIDLNGREITATVFFSDIQGFTSISEKLEPKQLVYYLNRYFEKVSNVILDYHAMLDKYIGDGIMAIFGAPLLAEDHAAQACRAALVIQKKLNTIKYEDNIPLFITRIGLNTGKMILGNIGTNRRMDYTAIGDAVNLSSRLEGMNKVFGTNILVAESTVKLCEEQFFFREIDMIAVKGKKNPVRVYELIESMVSITPGLAKFKNYFEEGLQLYREREWAAAIERFNNAQELRTSDEACKVYIDRCNNFINNPPDDNWNGVFYATTK